MKKKHIVSIIVSLIILSMITSCKKSEVANDGNKIQPVDVRIETIKPSRLVDAIQVSGTVKAFEDANISPEEGGVVKEWKAKKGQHVKKGELIVVLKDEVIKSSYDAAEAQYKMAELNLEKQKEVFNQQGISELQYKNLEYSRDAAKANADLMKARWERTQIRSPFDGVVDNTIPNEGEFAPPGVPIARIVNMSNIKIQAEVPELYSGTIGVGTQAIITFDALPGDTLKGKVSFVSSTVSAANRTMQIEIILPNSIHRLKPEMITKVKLLRETKSNAILVSENIIQLVDRNRAIVYVENSGKAKEILLKLGGRQGNMVEVLEGLKIGDNLIVTGFQKLIDGTPVIVSK
ncbi:MAG: efflux RND transporter periplasmic adaptor subunit [Bacteroidota bacterium]|nr:efflux RND transporter periplasmic adaptor subunit [Bacteroidota bacterium]